MASIREQGIQDVVNMLNTNRPVGVPLFQRSYSWGVTPAELPKNIVYPTDDDQMEGQDLSTRPVRRRYHTLASETLFKGDGVTVPDQLIDPIYVWILKTVVGQTKYQTLFAGIEFAGAKFHRAQADYPYCRMVIYLRVYYSAALKDPEQWATSA